MIASELYGKGPAIVGVLPKTKTYPSRIDWAINRCAPMMRHADGILPIVLDGRPVAWARGHGWRSPDVDILPVEQWSVFDNYQDILDALIAGRVRKAFWGKAQTTNYTANSSWYDLWPVQGVPIAGTYAAAAPLTSTAYDNNSTGALPLGPTPSSGQTKHIVYGGYANSLQATACVVYDRVLTYEQCPVSNALQTMTNSVSPARWAAVGQQGLRIVPTLQTASDATISTFTSLIYVDQGGNPSTLPTLPFINGVRAGQNATTPAIVIENTATTPGAAANCWHTSLATGDTGVQSITSYQFDATNATATLCFVLAYPLALIPTQNTLGAGTYDYATQWPWMARVYDSACISFLSFATANPAPMHQGHLSFIWG